MGKRRTRDVGPCPGFTLVDLVVAVGLAGLVVPLALPVLRDAGEQARIDQCLNNLHQVMRATSLYLADYDDFPLTLGSGYGVCSWGWGGQTNDDYWKYPGYFYFPATERPVNPYILGARVQPDVMEGSQVIARTPIPPLACPSDHVSHQRAFGGSPAEIIGLSCYNDVGTSYQFNLHAVMGVNWWGNANPWTQPGDWSDLARALLHDVQARQAATFTWLTEDPMDWGISDYNKIIMPGNHGEYGKHSCGYLDGHGDYLYRDTRGWCGVGWEAINLEWVRTPYSEPPIHYEPSGPVNNKNCDPPLDGAKEGER
jgi:type II secretory pathway pseudopilin PulG